LNQNKTLNENNLRNKDILNKRGEYTIKESSHSQYQIKNQNNTEIKNTLSKNLIQNKLPEYLQKENVQKNNYHNNKTDSERLKESTLMNLNKSPIQSSSINMSNSKTTSVSNNQINNNIHFPSSTLFKSDIYSPSSILPKSDIQLSSSTLPKSDIQSSSITSPQNDYQTSDLFKSTLPSIDRPLISYKTNNYKSSITEISHNLKGLSNLGNTCFMNTCLQNIIHTTPFIKRLVDVSHLIDPSKKLTDKFYKLCKEQTERIGTYSSPSEFKRAFGYKHIEYSGYPQQDTQEFCRYLLEDISKELNTAENKNFYQEIKTTNKSKIEINREFDEVFRKRENSIIVDTFYSQIINEFTCKNKNQTCGFKDYSCQKLLDFPLLFPDKKASSRSYYSTTSKYTLKDLLDYFFKPESIEFAVKCEGCGKKTEHEKVMKIATMPEILILSFQRISRYSSKNNSQVDFPEELDLSEFADMECVGNTPTKYLLYGIGNHTGSVNFGHYYAYIKIKNQWYEFNDSRVNVHSSIEFSGSTAYVLYYQRVDTL
jgi:ubiquitin C-terminal hydrolase